MIYFDLKLKYEIHNKFKFEFVFVLYNKEMNTTINPETGRKVIIGGPTYRRMAKKYYTDRNGQLLDQTYCEYECTNYEKHKRKNSCETS